MEQGATVVGERPTAKRSLADEDTEYERLCHLIWDNPNSGKVLAPPADLASVLREHFPPRVIVKDPPRVRRITRWVDGNQPLLFIANPVNEELRTTVTVPNTGGGLVAWDR